MRQLFLCVLGAALCLSGCGGSSSSKTSSESVPSSASLSTTSFDFGGNLVGNTLTSPVVTVTNTGATAVTLKPTVSGDPSFSLAPTNTCSATLAAGANCSVTVSYTPTAVSGTMPQTATLALGLTNVATSTPQSVALTGLSGTIAAGTVTASNNPQVAVYTVNLPFPGTVTVNFGPTSIYSRSTSAVTSTVAGPVSVLVAGMLANTTYHMQAALTFPNGLATNDADHTFTPQSPVPLPAATVTIPAGQAPQPGIELLTIITGQPFGLLATDLNGGLLWSYSPVTNGAYTIQGAHLLPNGHFLITLSLNADYLFGVTPPDGTVNAIREIDLAGNTIQEISNTQLTDKLAATGYTIPIVSMHHEITSLPNGHWLVLANTLKAFTDLPGYPGVTNVLGDVVIDLDQSLKPVWVWNEFDHLDVNRHPMLFPDWTHSNAVVYSPTDGNLLVSIRHQNWVVKVDYANGAGTGNILWRLGEGGDFTLKNGVDPTDWAYAQHYPTFFTPNTAGVFSLGLMDNGNDREFPTGVVCNTPGAPPCLYSTIPVYQIDEAAKTATLTFHTILPTNLYSFFGGNTDLLANGHVEYDLSATSVTASDIFETTLADSPEAVWHMHLDYIYAYRGYRMPSLYPGVQW